MKCLNCKNLGWGEEYPGKKFFGWCEEVCDAPELDRERECEHFVQAANSDIIRRMSDEELAEFLSDFKDCAGDCFVGKGVRDCSGICATSETLGIWLRQPAKEDT
jgi:hypothetical protein